MWEYQVAPSLCWLIPTMHVGSFVCLRVCFLLWSDFSFTEVFTHLLSAPPLSHVWISVYSARCCLFGLIPWCICSLSTCPRLSSPAEVLLRLQLLFTVAQTQEVTLIYVKSHDFLKQLVESLVQNGSGVIRQGRAWDKSGGFSRILSNIFSVFHFCNSISECWIHLIGVCDYQRPLLGKIVIDVRDDLNCDVCLSCPWRSNDL